MRFNIDKYTDKLIEHLKEKNYQLKFQCNDNTRIQTDKGNNSENDFKIFIAPDYEPWAPTFESLGWWLRLKGFVEDINYPHGKGKDFLFDYVYRSIYYRWISIPKLYKQYVTKFKTPRF